MTLKIGVQLPSEFPDAGEYLADARALDAAGADSLWLAEDGYDPWLILAGVAAVTGRARLVVPVSAADLGTPATLDTRMTTLSRLSRGRAVLSVKEPMVTLVVSRPVRCPVIVVPATGVSIKAAGLPAEGLVGTDDSPEGCRSTFEEIRKRRQQGALSEPYELWARIKVPQDREHWKRTLQEYEAAGTTGVVVPSDVRLLDLLRNPEGEDDRSDLILAQG